MATLKSGIIQRLDIEMQNLNDLHNFLQLNTIIPKFAYQEGKCNCPSRQMSRRDVDIEESI